MELTKKSVKADTRITINSMLIGVAATVLFIIIAINPKMLAGNFWLSLQLVLITPFLITSSLSYSKLAYKKEHEVLSCNITEFGKLVETREVNDDTIVFNNLVQSKKDFEIKWQVPYRESWLKNIESAHSSFSSML